MWLGLDPCPVITGMILANDNVAVLCYDTVDS